MRTIEGLADLLALWVADLREWPALRDWAMACLEADDDGGDWRVGALAAAEDRADTVDLARALVDAHLGAPLPDPEVRVGHELVAVHDRLLAGEAALDEVAVLAFRAFQGTLPGQRRGRPAWLETLHDEALATFDEANEYLGFDHRGRGHALRAELARLAGCWRDAPDRETFAARRRSAASGGAGPDG